MAIKTVFMVMEKEKEQCAVGHGTEFVYLVDLDLLRCTPAGSAPTEDAHENCSFTSIKIFTSRNLGSVQESDAYYINTVSLFLHSKQVRPGAPCCLSSFSPALLHNSCFPLLEIKIFIAVIRNPGLSK